ncbi:hypothetical protein B0T13DRAFT_463443 [Neurospora crassa]|nr:hypothetical protein B0T13DRAFT_463443 [Neurospora crassa]
MCRMGAFWAVQCQPKKEKRICGCLMTKQPKIGLCTFQEAAKACRDEDVYSGLALYNLSRWHSSTVSLDAV